MLDVEVRSGVEVATDAGPTVRADALVLATHGFGGNGVTFGALAAMLISGAIQGRSTKPLEKRSF
jgi:hypothetical protein